MAPIQASSAPTSSNRRTRSAVPPRFMPPTVPPMLSRPSGAFFPVAARVRRVTGRRTGSLPDLGRSPPTDSDVASPGSGGGVPPSPPAFAVAAAAAGGQRGQGDIAYGWFITGPCTGRSKGDGTDEML